MKRNFYSKIVKYRKPVIVFFAALTIVSALLYTKVYVDYNIVDYLPEEAPFTIDYYVMKKEFGGYLPNTEVMICDASQAEVLSYKKKIEAVDGVLSVTWLDSLLPANIPISVLPKSLTDSYYKDGNALLTITADEEKLTETIPAIYEIIGENNAMTGTAVMTAVATINTIKELIIITILSILFMLFVLALTTSSWAEPLIVMTGLIISVIINLGTHIIFGTISFVTNSAGIILQMAVSLDYTVFLIHRFDELKDHMEPEEAMTEALDLSSTSILSSGATTVIGFLALAFMKFGLGADLGLALSKGIAVSLTTTLIFMPGIILGTYKWMEKTRHRKLLPSLEKFGRLILRLAMPMVAVFVLIIVPSFICSQNNSFWYAAPHIYGTDTRAGADEAKIAEYFGDMDSYVIMVPLGNTSKERALIRELQDDPLITSILAPESVLGTSLPSDMLPDSITSQLRNDKYDRIVLSVAVDTESEKTYELVERLRNVSDKYFPGEYHLVGAGVSNYDIKEAVTSDMLKINLIAIIAVFAVLLLTMRNLLLPVVLVLVIETAIWVNMSITYVTGGTLYYIVYLIISSVQLGATVDYAILFTQRYRENRNDYGLSPRDSIVKTIEDNTVSILTSGIALSVMGFLLWRISTQRMIGQMGMLLGRGSICSMFLVLFVLPGILMMFDRFIIRSLRLRTGSSAGIKLHEN